MKIYRKLNGPAFTTAPTPDERAKMEVMRQAWLKLQKAAFSPEATAEQEGAYEKARKQYDDYVAKFTRSNERKPQFSELENALSDADKAKAKELKAKLEKAADGTDEEFKKAQKAYDDFVDTVKSNKKNGKEGLTVAKLEVQLREVDSKIDPRRSSSAQKALFDERQKILDDISLLKRFPNFYKNNATGLPPEGDRFQVLVVHKDGTKFKSSSLTKAQAEKFMESAKAKNPQRVELIDMSSKGNSLRIFRK